MSDLKQEVYDLYRRVQAFQMDALGVTSSATPGSVINTPVPDLVDVGFLCREIAKICDGLRKAFSAKQEIVGRYLATYAASQALQGNEVDLQGEMATGTPDVAVKPKIPPNNSPDFVKLMRWLGVPDDLITKDVLRPSFSALSEELTRRLATGEKPPPGIVTTYSDMLTVFRRKRSFKDNDDGSQQEEF